MDISSHLKKKAQKFSINEDGLLGKVWIGNTNQAICVPGNSVLTIPGRLGKNTRTPSGTPCLIDTTAVNNLPQGISVNCCLAHPKGNVVLVIMINQNKQNVWIQQPLLAAEIFGVQHIPWDYGVELQEGEDKIEVTFQPLPLTDVMVSVKVVHNEPDQALSKEETSQEPHPTFGPCPNTQVADFDFERDVEHLPFKLNLVDIHFDRDRQAKFINLIYSNQEVFPLHDEDLGYCNQLTHTTPMSTDKPVYLPHRTIHRQLQGEVCKFLNTWLCQGINHPSNSPYTSQVFIVHKSLGRFVSLWIIGN